MYVYALLYLSRTMFVYVILTIFDVLMGNSVNLPKIVYDRKIIYKMTNRSY